MAKNSLIAGLDVGTGYIKLLVAKPKEDQVGFDVVCQIKESSAGIRRGVVVDSEKASRIIQLILNKAKEELGERISAVFTNIGGSHLYCTSSRGMIVVSRADQKVSDVDVSRAIDSARTVSLLSNSEIMETFPKEFILDNRGGIKNVVGMNGGKLEVETMILAGFTPYVANLRQAVLSCDLQIADIVPSCLASADSVLTPKQKELGVAILDIGSGTCELAVFEEGELVHLAVIPIGSMNITNDIAIGLKTDIETAEAIKLALGNCVFKGKDKKERVEIEEESDLVFSKRTLSKIVQARVSEIFKEVQKELKNVQKQGLLPGGIVFTGGGAKTGGLIDLAKEEFKLPCRIGKPIQFYGLEDDLSYATACGLILKNFDSSSQQSFVSSSLRTGKIGEKIKRILKIFIP